VVSLNADWYQQGFEGTDLILLFLHIALPQDCSCGHIITTQQMNGMLLLAGGTHGFAING
jgi:hypothetical protein